MASSQITLCSIAQDGREADASPSLKCSIRTPSSGSAAISPTSTRRPSATLNNNLSLPCSIPLNSTRRSWTKLFTFEVAALVVWSRLRYICIHIRAYCIPKKIHTNCRRSRASVTTTLSSSAQALKFSNVFCGLTARCIADLWLTRSATFGLNF